MGELVRQVLGMLLLYTGALLSLPGAFVIALAYRLLPPREKTYLVIDGSIAKNVDEITGGKPN